MYMTHIFILVHLWPKWQRFIILYIHGECFTLQHATKTSGTQVNVNRK